VRVAAKFILHITRFKFKMSDVLFHIGYYKTGSTFLQRRVFTLDNGFCPLGSGQVFPYDDVRGGSEKIIFDTDGDVRSIWDAEYSDTLFRAQSRGGACGFYLMRGFWDILLPAAKTQNLLLNGSMV
jgi:hypothetical protein